MVDAIVALLRQMPVFLAPKPWEDWSLFSEQIARGVAIGSAYALVALAIVLVFRSSELLNFAQGEWGMFTTFVAWSLVVAGTAVGLTYVAAIALGAALAAVMFWGLVMRVRETLPLTRVAVTIAMFLMFNSAAVWVYARGQLPKYFPSPFGLQAVDLGPFTLSRHELGTLSFSLAVMLLLSWFFTRTKVGLAMRAAATNPEASRLMGINVNRMLTLGWAMGGALGSAAAFLIAPVTGLFTAFMFPVLIYAFAGAVLGGIISPPGAVVGGILIGIGENLLGTYSPSWLGSEMKLPLILLTIMAVLVVRPMGIFGEPGGGRA
jgi:branched-chain amino acid transport system permease protein